MVSLILAAALLSQPRPALVYRDGFESGDLSAWSSSTAPDPSPSGWTWFARTRHGTPAIMRDADGVACATSGPRKQPDGWWIQEWRCP